MNSNKVSIITGASEGIGAAIAEKMYSESYNLVLIARRQDVLEKFADKFDKEKCMLFYSDVLDYEAIDTILEKVMGKWGRIDVFVNNAGFHERGRFVDTSEKGISTMVRVNLEAPLIITSKVLNYFKEQKFGHIVQIASLAGRTPVVDSATYSATKFGLRAFTYAFVEELKRDFPNIHSSVISPGPVITNFILNDIENVADLTLSQPFSYPEEIAQMTFDSIKNKTIEEVSGGLANRFLTNFGYVFPNIKKLFLPLLKMKGRKVREKIIQNEGFPKK